MQKMLPVFMLLVISALAGCCVHAGLKHPDSRATLVDELRSNTVALVIRDGDGDITPYCSGVWIDRDKIITADHCARAVLESALELDADEPDHRPLIQVLEKGFEVQYVVDSESTGVWREPKQLHKAIVEKFDYEHDLALLVVKDVNDIPPHHIAPLAANVSAQGDTLHIMGHPMGLTWTYGKGVVAAVREENFRLSKKVGPWLQVAAPAWRGNSGGGAYNDAGELIGLAAFLTSVPHNVMFVHIDTIRSFLGRPVPR